jgi:hypothetical protein
MSRCGRALGILLFAVSLASSRTFAGGGPPVPDPSDLMSLVHKSILAVAEGNAGGDYIVLNTMGSPAFKAGNTPETLAKGFADLRTSGVDLMAVRHKIPLTTRTPTMDKNGWLRILGYYELPEHQIVYDVLYDYDMAAGAWQLAGILVKPRILPPQPQLMQPE